MDALASLLARGPVEPWTAIVADYQTDGRGRRGQSWLAAPGSALLATVYAPISIDSSRAGLIATAAGLSVVDALARYGLSAQLKWPNDVLALDRKLGGILIVSRLDERLHASVGIGVNVTASPDRACSIADVIEASPSPMDLLGEIRSAMRRRWLELERGQYLHVRDAWNDVAAWKGEIVVGSGEGGTTGQLLGIDEWGRLRLLSDRGEVVLTPNQIVRGPVPLGTASYTSH